MPSVEDCEELQRVGAPAPGEHEQQRETEEDAPDHNRRTAGRMHATDCGGQQSLPVGVEHHPGLGVHAGDQYAQRRGQPRQVGEEGERVQGVVGDADEGDLRLAQGVDVLAELLHRDVAEEHVAGGHQDDAGEDGPGHVAARVVRLLGQRGQFPQPMNR